MSRTASVRYFVKVARFDPGAELIIVPAGFGGVRDECPQLNMVLDTGSEETVVIPEVLEGLG